MPLHDGHLFHAVRKVKGNSNKFGDEHMAGYPDDELLSTSKKQPTIIRSNKPSGGLNKDFSKSSFDLSGSGTRHTLGINQRNESHWNLFSAYKNDEDPNSYYSSINEPDEHILRNTNKKVPPARPPPPRPKSRPPEDIEASNNTDRFKLPKSFGNDKVLQESRSISRRNDPLQTELFAAFNKSSVSTDPNRRLSLVTKAVFQHNTSEPHAIALYDFDSDVAGDLNFIKGDLIKLISEISPEWLSGVNPRTQQEGMFPAHFVEVRVPLIKHDIVPESVPLVNSTSNNSTSSIINQPAFAFHKPNIIPKSFQASSSDSTGPMKMPGSIAFNEPNKDTFTSQSVANRVKMFGGLKVLPDPATKPSISTKPKIAPKPGTISIQTPISTTNVSTVSAVSLEPSRKFSLPSSQSIPNSPNKTSTISPSTGDSSSISVKALAAKFGDNKKPEMSQKPSVTANKRFSTFLPQTSLSNQQPFSSKANDSSRQVTNAFRKSTSYIFEKQDSTPTHFLNHTPSLTNKVRLEVDLSSTNASSGMEPSIHVALYDYLSDNSGDLNFHAGDHIKILRHVNNEWAEGCIVYSTNVGLMVKMQKNEISQVGMFPSSFVGSAIQEDARKSDTEKNAVANHSLHDSTALSTFTPLAQANKDSQTSSYPVWMTAIFDFPKEQNDDLALVAGGFVLVLKRLNGDWLFGRIREREGMFPLNFVQPMAEEDVPNAKAIYDFKAEAAGDLELLAKDEVILFENVNTDWYKGRCKRSGEVGIFPKSFVVVVRPIIF